jgi:hypothetical protein
MNRGNLLGAAPTSEALHTGPDHRRKSICEDYIGVVLDAIEADRREPDEWEAHELASALGAIVSRWYFLSVNCTMKALVPPEQRGETYSTPQERHTLRDLRDALRYVSGMSALNR